MAIWECKAYPFNDEKLFIALRNLSIFIDGLQQKDIDYLKKSINTRTAKAVVVEELGDDEPKPKPKPKPKAKKDEDSESEDSESDNSESDNSESD